MNLLPRSAIIDVGFLATLAVLAGCSSQNVAYDSARVAHQHLAIATEQIDEKIEAENRYYEEIIRAIEEGAVRARSDELIERITQLARNHVQEHREQKARNAAYSESTDSVRQLLETAVEEWGAADAKRNEVISTALNDLHRGRQTLELERSKLGQLKSQLAVLSRGRNDQQMFEFLMRYGRAVKISYDTLRDESEAAAASDTTTAIPGSPGAGSDSD